MAKDTRSYNDRFVERVKAFRESRMTPKGEMTQSDMAEALGITLDRYQKYEQRTPLPHRFVKRFCLVIGISVEDLFDLERPVLKVIRPRRLS